jgi:hypothetical protein
VKNAHDSPGSTKYDHFAFILLTGIIRVSIAKVKLDAALRGVRCNALARRNRQIKTRCSEWLSAFFCGLAEQVFDLSAAQ